MEECFADYLSKPLAPYARQACHTREEGSEWTTGDMLMDAGSATSDQLLPGKEISPDQAEAIRAGLTCPGAGQCVVARLAEVVDPSAAA
jgi:hypothetical protein